MRAFSLNLSDTGVSGSLVYVGSPQACSYIQLFSLAHLSPYGFNHQPSWRNLDGQGKIPSSPRETSCRVGPLTRSDQAEVPARGGMGPSLRLSCPADPRPTEGQRSESGRGSQEGWVRTSRPPLGGLALSLWHQCHRRVSYAPHSLRRTGRRRGWRPVPSGGPAALSCCCCSHYECPGRVLPYGVRQNSWPPY